MSWNTDNEKNGLHYTILFEDTDSSFFRFRISAGSQYTIIMMYAGSSEDFSLPLIVRPFSGFPFKKSDSKCFLYNIFSKCCTQSIKIRMITVPELCVRNFHYGKPTDVRYFSTSCVRIQFSLSKTSAFTLPRQEVLFLPRSLPVHS